ncbi:MAG: VOC family protein [Gammaproteobacteria bacterium]|nr:VOC family protein [Gammaproteobacteria bacterium]
MKLKYAILYVEDVARSLDFYQRAFDFDIKFLHEGGDYGELDTGLTTLSFSSLALMSDLGKSVAPANPRSPTFEIALETLNVENAVAQAIRAGATLVQNAREESWGQTTAYVSDLDGFLIEICSPVVRLAEEV